MRDEHALRIDACGNTWQTELDVATQYYLFKAAIMMITHSRTQAQRVHSIALNRRVSHVPRRVVRRALTAEQVGLAFVLIAPGTAALIYSAIRGKGNVSDGFSHLLTILSQGYLQPDAGGKEIPVATGDLSEFGDSYITFLYNVYVASISGSDCVYYARAVLCFRGCTRSRERR